MAAELASSKLNPDTHLLFDQPLLKVPLELQRKNFKSAQRVFEHTRDNILASLKTTTEDALKKQTQDTSETLSSVDSMIARMENFKKKLQGFRADEDTLHRHSRARIQHLDDLHQISSLSDVKYEQWSKTRLNRLLIDYLLRCSHGDTARALARATNIEELVDIEAFVQCSRIEESLANGRTQEALIWCADNKAALKKNDSELEFELRFQQYIELIRASKLTEARAYARKHLTSQSDPSQAIKAAGLLALPPGSFYQPYAAFYSTDRWQYLVKLFLRTHHNLLALPSHPALCIALSAGLSALKTPSCHSEFAASSGDVSNATSGKSVCPICSEELNELAKKVPYAHHTKSHVELDPVVLPTGRIYGRERLIRLNEKLGEQISAKGRGGVVDPMDPKTVWDWSEVKKVYIS